MDHIAHQAPLSMEFFRRECWSGLPSPTPGDLPYCRTEPASLVSPELASGFFVTSAVYQTLCIGETLVKNLVHFFLWCVFISLMSPSQRKGRVAILCFNSGTLGIWSPREIVLHVWLWHGGVSEEIKNLSWGKKRRVGIQVERQGCYLQQEPSDGCCACLPASACLKVVSFSDAIPAPLH